ncbi:MAG: endonuclease III [Nitrospira sp. CG24C]|nr:MAG: endonuclease III [Nitrospira sp. CG24C]
MLRSWRCGYRCDPKPNKSATDCKIEKEETLRRSSQRKIANLLQRRYFDFPHYNKNNPLDELIFILLSVTTTEAVYSQTYRSFKNRFPCYADLLRASIQEIAKPIYIGGQFTQKATAIKSIIGILNDRFGRPSLSPLHKMSDVQCEEFLTSLPRVGKKVARCVMLYSLGRKVFPVDTHCRRVAQRLGWIDSEEFDEDLLQSMIPGELRFSLHVNFISLGREFCTSKAPSCGKCPLKQLCPKIGLSKGTR